MASKQYLNNKDFLQEIIKSKAQDRLTPDAEKMMILLGKKTIAKMRYYNPADREDCLQTGYLMMFSNWHCFDPERSDNAFAYFTEIFKRAIAKGWNELYKVKGDPDGKIKTFSLNGANDGEGLYNL